MTPPLGLGYIASVLREKNHSVRITDLSFDANLPGMEEFEIVGITSMTSNYPDALRVAGKAKAAGKKVVVGGYHASFMDEEVLATGLVDYVVRGEGEYVMLDLVNALESGADSRSVKGVSYVEKGRVVRTGDAEMIEDLDSLPFPARDLMPMRAYPMKLDGAPMTSVITSRGCPYNCGFCAASRFCGSKWRARSPESVVDEVIHIKRKFGFKAISFTDDNFLLSPKRVSEICDRILRNRVNMNWMALCRADTIVKEEHLVEKMHRAGARILFLGIESGNQEILDGYGKREEVEIFHRAISMLRTHGIRTWASFIIGAVGESKKMVQKTLDLAKKLDPYGAQFSILTPYPGTALFDSVKHRLVHKNWSLFDGQHSVFKTDSLSNRELERLLRKAYREFYMRPRRLAFEFGKSVNEGRVFDAFLKGTKIALKINSA
jgi:anaerobic magnesium-protoporphyrin IX monomethyl ester cyclase